jgi:hypothetical protein
MTSYIHRRVYLHEDECVILATFHAQISPSDVFATATSSLMLSAWSPNKERLSHWIRLPIDKLRGLVMWDGRWAIIFGTLVDQCHPCIRRQCHNVSMSLTQPAFIDACTSNCCFLHFLFYFILGPQFLSVVLLCLIYLEECKRWACSNATHLLTARILVISQNCKQTQMLLVLSPPVYRCIIIHGDKASKHCLT